MGGHSDLAHAQIQNKPPTEKEVEQTLFAQLEKLAAYKKRYGKVKILDGLGFEDDAMEISQCSRFWDKLSSLRRSDVPIPLDTGVSVKKIEMIVNKAFQIALKNRELNKKKIGLNSEDYENFSVNRKVFKNNFFRDTGEIFDYYFNKEKFTLNLISQLINPLFQTYNESYFDVPSEKDILIFNPRFSMYENKINFGEYRELVLATFSINKKNISIVTMGVDASGMLKSFIENFSQEYYGVTDDYGNFDEVTLQKIDGDSLRNPLHPSILNGLILQEGIVFRWSLKLPSNTRNGRIFSINKLFNSKYVITVEDISSIGSNYCHILIK